MLKPANLCQTFLSIFGRRMPLVYMQVRLASYFLSFSLSLPFQKAIPYLIPTSRTKSPKRKALGKGCWVLFRGQSPKNVGWRVHGQRTDMAWLSSPVSCFDCWLKYPSLFKYMQLSIQVTMPAAQPIFTQRFSRNGSFLHLLNHLPITPSSIPHAFHTWASSFSQKISMM